MKHLIPFLFSLLLLPLPTSVAQPRDARDPGREARKKLFR
jgi:hypothetical protein